MTPQKDNSENLKKFYGNLFESLEKKIKQNQSEQVSVDWLFAANHFALKASDVIQAGEDLELLRNRLKAMLKESHNLKMGVYPLTKTTFTPVLVRVQVEQI